MDQQQSALALVQPPKVAVNDSGDKKHLRQYPMGSDQQYIPFDWARVMLEQGVKIRP